MKKSALLIVLFTFLCTAVTFAYHGPYTAMDIATVQSQGQDDQRITLEGKFTEHLYRDNYTFQDTSGATMTVEVDDDCLHQLTMDRAVRVYGEIDIDYGGLKVEIDRIENL